MRLGDAAVSPSAVTRPLARRYFGVLGLLYFDMPAARQTPS